MDCKEEFIKIYKENIKRNGSEKLLEWLCNTDFFTAPASSRFHSCFEGGLAYHSLLVYKTLMEKYFDAEKDNKESFTLCPLLHDLCKARYYKVSTRNVKNDVTGRWEQVPYYSIEDAFPYGHGEKSVYLIERFMRLSPEEAIAIRWHMGGFDDSVKAGNFSMSVAFEKYPLAVKLHLADLESTYLKEGRDTLK